MGRQLNDKSGVAIARCDATSFSAMVAYIADLATTPKTLSAGSVVAVVDVPPEATHRAEAVAQAGLAVHGPPPVSLIGSDSLGYPAWLVKLHQNDR